jgi:hypothetical protein
LSQWKKVIPRTTDGKVVATTLCRSVHLDEPLRQSEALTEFVARISSMHN